MANQQVSSQRVIYLDLLRVIATFAVILLHVSASEFLSPPFSSDRYIALVFDSLVRWSVPVFVMISGALYLNPNKEITYREILGKRVPRLLLAYVFWTVLYVLYDYVVTGFEGFSISDLTRKLLLSRFHLWFLPMLMGVYLLIPILRKIAQDKKLLKYSLVILVLYVCISFFSFISLFQMASHFYPLFTMNMVVGFAGYFLLGCYLSQQSLSKRQRLVVYLVGVLGAFITIAGTIYMSMKQGVPNERYYSYLSFQVMAMAAAVFVFVRQLAPKAGKVVLRFVEWVRKDLFGVYLVHVLWLALLNTETFRHCCHEIITLPLIAVAVFVLSLFTTKLIRLVPFLRKVVE